MSYTRKEWLEVKGRIDRAYDFNGFVSAETLTEAALGCPCPPNPDPGPEWRSRSSTLSAYVENGAVLIGTQGGTSTTLTAHDARELSPLLLAMSDYIRSNPS